MTDIYKEMGITFRDPQQAFKDAIAASRLSTIKGRSNYVGNYMYMGTQDGKDMFKNINTRAYDV